MNGFARAPKRHNTLMGDLPMPNAKIALRVSSWLAWGLFIAATSRASASGPELLRQPFDPCANPDGVVGGQQAAGEISQQRPTTAASPPRPTSFATPLEALRSLPQVRPGSEKIVGRCRLIADPRVSACFAQAQLHGDDEDAIVLTLNIYPRDPIKGAAGALFPSALAVPEIGEGDGLGNDGSSSVDNLLAMISARDTATDAATGTQVNYDQTTELTYSRATGKLVLQRWDNEPIRHSALRAWRLAVNLAFICR
jgi:hypothetical protein